MIEKEVNPSTPQHKCWALLRVDPERRFTPRPEGRGLAPPNGSNRAGTVDESTSLRSGWGNMLRSSVLTKKGIKTRTIRAEDIPLIVSIQESIIKKKVSMKWVQMVEHHLRKQEAVGFVASREGQIVGFIIGEIKGEGFGLEQSGWIEVVGVHPRQMGIGIGQALAKKLFEFFKKKGVLDVYTAVRWDAEDMLSFFKSLGFDRSTFINLRKHLD